MNLVYATSLLYLILGVIIILLGFIILKENLKQRINRITGLMMFFAGTGPIFVAFDMILKLSPVPSINLEPFRKMFLIWEFFFPQMLLFSFVFPRQIGWVKQRPYIIYLIFLPHIIHFLLVLSFSNPEQVCNIIDLPAISEQFGLIAQPAIILLGFFLALLSLIYKFHINFFALINLIYIITAISFMVWGYHNLRIPRLKKQVGLVLWGIRASVGLYAIAFIFPRLKILHTTPAVSHLLTSVALLIGAGSIAWAIIRYQFLDIRLIIRRGLIFSITSAALIGIYLLIYGQGKRFITGLFDIHVPVLEILFIILALLFFQPTLGAVERFIERIFMKDRMDYRNVLKDLSRDVMTTIDTALLRQKIITTLKEVFSLENIELITVNRDGTYSNIQEGKSLSFNPQEEWIQIIKEIKEPVGCDELCFRIKDEQSLDKLRELNAFLLIPFVSRENLIGILILGEKITKTSFNTEDMTILSVLSNQAAIALENANLYHDMLDKQRIEEEINLAREIQKNLLPYHFPSGDHYELTGYNLPSKEVGGDYYDFIPIDEHKIGIAIGDIAGKGIPAAILMSNLQAALRISASQTITTQDVMRQVNIQITRTTTAEKFATFFYGVFDTENFSFEYSNAGHNFPILWRNHGVYNLLRKGGIVIGVMEDALYESELVSMSSGDFLVMYTDGITEALNPSDEEFGEQRLLQTLENVSHKSAQDILDSIIDAVSNFTHNYLQFDDLTLVVLKVK